MTHPKNLIITYKMIPKNIKKNTKTSGKFIPNNLY